LVVGWVARKVEKKAAEMAEKLADDLVGMMDDSMVVVTVEYLAAEKAEYSA
jgi:hypothetical protein